MENSESNISSFPSDHVIHFNTQLSPFRCSQRFFTKHDLTSLSIEESDVEEEEVDETEEEEKEHKGDDDDSEEEYESEENNSEEEDSEDEDSEGEDNEPEENVNGHLISDSENSQSNISNIPSDRVIHFNTQLSLFKCSQRFFTKHDLTPLSIEESDVEQEQIEEEKEEGDDDNYDDDKEEEEEEEEEEGVDEEEEELEEKEEESEDEESGGEELVSTGLADQHDQSDEVYSSSSIVVEGKLDCGAEEDTTVNSSLKETSHTSCNVPVSITIINN